MPSGDKAIAIRRASVNNFVFGPGRDELAALLLDLTLKGLQIPDQILMAKSIRIFQYLCTEQTSEKHANDSHVHGWADERIAIYMGTTVFGTCLGTLVRDERLLALDYVILMEDILSRFEPLRSRINSTNPDISSAPFSDEEVMSMPPCAVIAKFSGCSVGLVLGLCTTISTLKAKKARRDALRDLVTDIMMHAKGKSDQKLNLIMNLPFPSR